MSMENLKADDVRQGVRENYAAVARKNGACGCSGGATSCCGTPNAEETSRQLGYSAEELAAVPDGANMGLGCGNPQAIAALQPGETVLDLGSGGGFDCFLAAQRVGPQGHVIGVDMTPEMLSKARQNAVSGGYANVEFRLGEIEALPVADASVDVIISNCVINLSPEKARVFREAARVLKPGGRLAVSDVVAIAKIPPEMREDMALVSGCIAGASTVPEVEAMLQAAGFTNIAIRVNEASREYIREWAPGRGIEEYVASATIEAVKLAPAERSVKPVLDTRHCSVDPNFCTVIPACPQQAIEYVKDDEEPIGGRIAFDLEKCDGCGICATVCCGSAISMQPVGRVVEKAPAAPSCCCQR